MLGVVGWTGSYAAESVEDLQSAVDLGSNFFDTAWAYGEGRSEQIVGKVLRANAGKKLYVATKIPPKNLKWPSRRDFMLDDCYPPDHIEAYVNKSLANLGVEKLDLIQFHTWEDRWLNDERLPRVVEKLRASGKAEAIGVSVNRWEPCNGIPGMRNRRNVEANIAASTQGPLPAALQKQLRTHRWDRNPTSWSQ